MEVAAVVGELGNKHDLVSRDTSIEAASGLFPNDQNAGIVT